MITAAITDDESLFRSGFRRLIEDMDNTEVLFEAQNGQGLLDQLNARKGRGEALPEVLLLDLQMPVMNGVEAARILQKYFPDVKIIVISTHFSKAFVCNSTRALVAPIQQ